MSPLKRSTTTPNLRPRSQQLLREDLGDEDDDEDDEETLKLKLAAIEARLKLKRLQNRAKTGRSSSDVEGDETQPRPSSAIRRPQRDVHSKGQEDEVQVPLSPTRKVAPPTEPESPRRFLLGIDKGMRGKDVSLRRPPNSRVQSRPQSAYGVREGATSRSAQLSSALNSSSFRDSPRPKSFSERIAESRSAEKDRRERAEKVQKNRSSAFQFDKEEMERFKAAAAEVKPALKSPTRSRPVESFSREDVLRSYHQPTSAIKRSQTTPNVRTNDLTRPSSSSRDTQSFQEYRPRSQGRSESPGVTRYQSHVPGEVDEDKNTDAKVGDASKYEPFSSLHLSSRILPHSFLSRTLEGKKIITIPQLLKMVKAPDFELDVDDDYVVFGIVASKSSPREHKEPKNIAKEADPFDDGLNNTNKYMAISLTDLKWTVDLFLFDTAFPRYYKLSEGILIAILNPTIMPPPPNKIDTNRFSLAISSSDDTILEIGYAQDIGFCKAVRKDGKTCHSWVDARKTEFCDFHIDVQIRRTQAQRPGVNGGTGMFGPGGRSGPRTGFFGGEKRGGHRGTGLKPEGAQYDTETQSTFYVARAPKMNNNYDHSFDPTNPFKRNQSAANLIDADDPFLAAGMMGRGKDNKAERLRRRLAEQQNERNIKKLVTSGAVTGIGAEYLRTRVSENRPSSSPCDNTPASTETKAPRSAMLPSSSMNDFNLSALRARDVRLGPKKRAHDGDKPSGAVKKTRFITPKGIREAGRDSLGGPSDLSSLVKASNNNDYDDDDELDII